MIDIVASVSSWISNFDFGNAGIGAIILFAGQKLVALLKSKKNVKVLSAEITNIVDKLEDVSGSIENITESETTKKIHTVLGEVEATVMRINKVIQNAQI